MKKQQEKQKEEQEDLEVQEFKYYDVFFSSGKTLGRSRFRFKGHINLEEAEMRHSSGTNTKNNMVTNYIEITKEEYYA